MTPDEILRKAEIAKARAAYPLKTCLVSDEALGSMGEAAPYIHRVAGQSDRVVFFCCGGCTDDFDVCARFCADRGFERGDIVDRNGVPLARSIYGYAIWVKPADLLGDRKQLANQLAAIFPDTPAAEFYAKLTADKPGYLRKRALPDAMPAPEQSPLGKASAYTDHYDPTLLFPIPRADKRREIGVLETPPFFGADLWTSFELSWLNPRGKPQVAIATKASVVNETPRRIDNSESHLRAELEISLRRLNRDHVERLIAEGRMTEHGLAHVEADGGHFAQFVGIQPLGDFGGQVLGQRRGTGIGV